MTTLNVISYYHVTYVLANNLYFLSWVEGSMYILLD